MGTWGTGLYANDVAADLKATIGSLLRLPFEPDEILEQLQDAETALGDPGSEDYPACWFVVADRLHRYGIDHAPTFDLVRELIAEGIDLRVNEALGMSAADLRRRAKVLQDLADRLATPHPKPYRRSVLTEPQPLIVEIGDVLRFPMMGERSANPYFKSWEAQRPPFVPDAFGAAVIVDRGRAFGYLAWYTALMLNATWPGRPSLTECLTAAPLRPRPGTLSVTHFKRMAIEKVDVVRLREAIQGVLPEPSRAISVAVSDISVSNVLNLSRSPRLALTQQRLRDLLVV